MASLILTAAVNPDGIRNQVSRLLDSVPGPRVPEPIRTVKKVIVAVHGIGDQYRSATIQTVAHRFCRYLGRPAAIPLGQFHGPDATVTRAYVPGEEQFPGGFSGELGFVEVYWANIPREPVEEAHTLEEPKRWAKSIVGRLHVRMARTRREQAENRLSQADRRLAEADQRLGMLAPVRARTAQGLQKTARALQAGANASQGRARTKWAQVKDDRTEADQVLSKVNRLRDELSRIQHDGDAHRRTAEELDQATSELARKTDKAARSEDDARREEETARLAESRARAAEEKARSAEVKVHPGAGHDAGAQEARKALRKARRAWTAAAPPTDQQDFDLLAQVIEEMITGVAVAEHLTFLATRMGLISGFSLKKLLDDYLNDVQLVTEFPHYRGRMLDVFRGVMDRIQSDYPDADIYVVAHSEGTVVSFLGLLEGLSGSRDWIRKIQGYMTIGSPLNKHVILWPEIFEDLCRSLPRIEWAQKIPWRNYYDHGDPIGFDLGPTRDWMEAQGLDRSFEFQGPEDAPEPNRDHGFTRYSLPGAAHNDYWDDGEVFGHFIQEVVNARPPQLYPERPGTQYGIPRTNPFAWLTSSFLPYLLAAGLLFLAVFVLYKAVRGCIDPREAASEPSVRVARNVAGLACLIAGMTVMARLPRLTRAHRRSWRYWRIRLLGIALFAIFATAFSRLVPWEMQSRLVRSLELYGGPTAVLIGLGILVLLILLIVWSIKRTDQSLAVGWFVTAALIGAAGITGLWLAWPYVVDYPSAVLAGLAALVGAEAWILSRSYPALGLKPLLYSGGLVIFFLVISRIAATPSTAAAPPRGGAEVRAMVNVQGIVAALREKEAADAEVRARAARSEERVGATRLNAEAAQVRMQADAARRLASQGEASLAGTATQEGPIWPVFLAGLLFLYLWWLAALTFDLTFVWHSYIRRQTAVEYLRQVS